MRIGFSLFNTIGIRNWKIGRRFIATVAEVLKGEKQGWIPGTKDAHPQIRVRIQCGGMQARRWNRGWHCSCLIAPSFVADRIEFVSMKRIEPK